MACFAAPVVGAITTILIRRSIEKKNKPTKKSIPWPTKLKWLEKLFFGGALLLAFEHVWHGEIIFSFPFLTAIKSGESMDILKEIATVGSAMTGLILVVWFGMILIAEHLMHRKNVVFEA